MQINFTKKRISIYYKNFDNKTELYQKINKNSLKTKIKKNVSQSLLYIFMKI